MWHVQQQHGMRHIAPSGHDRRQDGVGPVCLPVRVIVVLTAFGTTLMHRGGIDRNASAIDTTIASHDAHWRAMIRHSGSPLAQPWGIPGTYICKWQNNEFSWA